MTTLSEILIPYRPDRNPDTTPVEEVFTNPEAGTNCELLVHAIVSARGFELPQLRSSDIYEDAAYTSIVDDISQAETGDIIGLCPVDKKGFKGIHIGMVWVNGENINVVHNARYEGSVKIQPIGEAMQYPKHAKIAWIKRPVKENPTLLQTEALKQLGFGYLARDL